mmetsp:Transcript_46623/g.108889  ORF Transcript_46623/g.108889 Transcript_46623/m.108889 type:complete len:512 (-) Transcript_46623:143-1678(-)
MDMENGGLRTESDTSGLYRAPVPFPAKAMKPLSPLKIALILLMAVVANIFTNVNPVAVAAIVSMTCVCILAEGLERCCSFFMCLLPTGLAMGFSCWGYLEAAALLIGVAAQIACGLGYSVHGALARRHPDVWLVIFAFPCVNTAIWALAMVTLPVGATASPVYDVAQWPILLQIASLLGRSSVTFVLSVVAAGTAHFFTTGKRRALEVGLGLLLLTWTLGGVLFYASNFARDMSETGPGGAPSEYYHVSCLNDIDNIYDETKRRLQAGDTVVIHSERSSGTIFFSSDSEDLIQRYSALLQSNFVNSSNRTEAVVVLSFVGADDKSWYHLVSRHGSEMSYAKNHPVPFVETDIVAGTSPPYVASVVIGNAYSEPVAVSGSICFDTDFPLLTRHAASADLFLETSETWGNIGWQHLQGHRVTAVENGQTLVKCTTDGYTGAIDRRGSIYYQVPSSSGTLSFSIPRYPGRRVFTPLYAVFDAVVGLLAVFWIILAASPALSTKFLSRLYCRSCE